MGNRVLIISLLVAVLVLESIAFAQDASTTTDPAAPTTTEPEKPKMDAKSFVRTVGGGRSFAPGQKKRNALEQTAKAFAPGQVKKVAGVVSAKAFAFKPLDATARRKKIFEETAKKVKPHKPVKGYEKSYRGTPYKPTKLGSK